MNATELIIRSMAQADWPAVCKIYQEGIDTGIATFETDVPVWKAWDDAHLAHSRLIAEKNQLTVGWAAISAVSNRCVYEGVAEVSIYVADAQQGCGVGTTLLKALMKNAEENGIWTLQAGIFAENKGSVRLHQKCGFRVIGRREKLGCLHGDWKDVMLLEYRSKSNGIT